MSPWALKEELIDIKININIEPKNIIFIYFIDNSNVSWSLFIELMMEGLKYIPITVMMSDAIIERINDWEKTLPEFSKLFSPILLAINDVVPILKPTPKAMITKYMGKIWPIAANAESDIILPAKIESTIEYKFWNIVPIEEGMAILIKRE